MSQLKANLVANFAGIGALALVQFVCAPLYIRFLGIETYGLIGFFMTLQAALRVLDLGLSPTMNREMARYAVQPASAAEMRNLVRTFEVGYWLVGLAAGGIICGLAPFIVSHWINIGSLPAGGATRAVMLMGATVAVQWPLSLYQGGLMGLQRQVLSNAIKVSAALASGGGAVLVLWLRSPTLTAFFVWQIAVGLANVLAMAVSLWRSLPKSDRPAAIDFAPVRRVLSFAGGMSGIGFFGMILTQMDKIVLSKLLPLEMFGYYTLASLLASSVQLFISPVFSAIFPRLSTQVAVNSEQSISKTYHDGTQLMVVLVVPLALVVALFASEILQVWTGNSSLAGQASLIVLFLTLGTAINGIMFLPYALQLSHGWTSIGFGVTVAMCVAMLPALIFMATHFGPAGAASVWLILNVLNLLIAFPLTHKRLLRREAREWIAADVALPIAAAATVVLFARAAFSFPSNPIAVTVDLVAIFLTAQMFAVLAASRVRVWAFRQASVLLGRIA